MLSWNMSQLLSDKSFLLSQISAPSQTKFDDQTMHWPRHKWRSFCCTQMSCQRTAEDADDEELRDVLHAQRLEPSRLQGPQEQDLHDTIRDRVTACCDKVLGSSVTGANIASDVRGGRPATKPTPT